MTTSPYHGCGDNCILACEYFLRPDSTDLGPNWCEQSGDWEIVHGNLVGRTEGIAVFTRKVHPSVGYFMARITDVRVGCVYQQESRCDPLYLKFCVTKNPCETHLPSGWTCCEGSEPPPGPYGTQGSFCIEITA